MPGKRLRWKLLTLVAVVMLLAACGESNERPTPTPTGGASEPTPTATATEDETALDGTAWLLAAIGGADVDLQTPITLSFTAGQAGGNAGCNDYGGAYTAGPEGDFSMPEIVQTDMACETGMELEAECLAALGEATSYGVVDDVRLELAGSDGETTLVFSRDDRQALDDTSWLMIELDGQLPVTDTEVMLELRAGEVSGSAGCNTYFGNYTADEDGHVSIDELAWTEMGCPEPAGLMEQEQAFLDALTQIESYEFDVPNNHLRLSDGDSRTRIVLANQDELPGTVLLDETGWVATEIHGRETTETTITIMFVSSQFAGKIGCVSYAGAIQTAPGGGIPELRPFSSYDGACGDQEPPEIAPDYLDALDSAIAYRLTSDRLELLDPDGAVVLAYRPGVRGRGELDGTEWELRSLDGAALIEGTTITLSFIEVWATGNAGCNSYGGQYMLVEEGVISIADIGGTLVGCTDPSGVLDQEMAYLALFSQIVAYNLTGSQLELLDEAGQVRIVFERHGG